MLLLDLNLDYFRVVFTETSAETTFDDAKKIGTLGQELFKKPAFIIVTSGVALDGEPFVEGIVNSFEKNGSTENKEVTLFGGKAGDDLALEASYVFSNKKSSSNALVALIVDEDKIEVSGIATCGWNAIGTKKTVTKSIGNTVYTIDDKPALDMLMNYLGVEIKQDGDKEIVTFLSSWYYPLQVERERYVPSYPMVSFEFFLQ